MNSSVRSGLVVAFNKSIAEEINMRIRNPKQLPPRTQYVQDICDAVCERNGNIVVNALAGSGKTTALQQIISEFPGADFRASTLHSFGNRAYSYAMRGKGINEVKLEENKVSILIRQLTDYERLNADDQKAIDVIAGSVHRLVDLSRTHLFTSVKPEPTDDDLNFLCGRYDVDLPDSRDTGMNDGQIFDLVRKTLHASNNVKAVIDFVDMIHMPLHENVSFYQNDLILCDESQDLDPSQIELIRRASARGQVVFVGDRNQAIYGFRGADVEAIESVVEIFKARELPLSTCWRCPTEVIREAQTIVPEIEDAPNAIEGKVDSLPNHDAMVKMAEAGDFVLCRTTAPLVATCMRFIRNGKAATVRGRDIGKGLETLVDKIKRRRGNKGKKLIHALIDYREEQMIRLAHPSKEQQRQSMADKLDTLLVLSEECNDFDGLKRKIGDIFSDVQGEGTKGLILCSTAHKAKGLEAERVFVIHPELMPHPMARQAWQKKQEMHLRYVAITRATRELYWVHEGIPDKAPIKPLETSDEKPVPENRKKAQKVRSDKGKPRKVKIMEDNPIIATVDALDQESTF